MTQLKWKWDPESLLHDLYAGSEMTGFRIEPPEEDDDDHPFLGPLAHRFNCIFPGGDTNVIYDTLDEAKRACEDYHELLGN